MRKIFSKFFFKIVQFSRVAIFKALSNNKIAGNPKIKSPLQTVGKGEISIDDSVVFGVFPSPYFFSTYCYIEARSVTSRVTIKKGTFINNGFSAISEASDIYIGERCLIGTSVEIMDSDFHALHPTDRKLGYRPESGSIIIGNDVFIGSNVKILKGVTIGDACVIGSGSLVVQSIPEGTVAAGVPAKALRKLMPKETHIEDAGNSAPTQPEFFPLLDVNKK